MSVKTSPRGADGPDEHAGTPWAGDRPERGERDDDVRMSTPDGEARGNESDDFSERWVVLFGFTEKALADVLLDFQKDGDVERRVFPRGSTRGEANYCFVRFSDVASARRAARRDGTLSGGAMVGVRRLDATHREMLRLAIVGDAPGGDGVAPRGAEVVRLKSGGASAPSSRPHSWRPARDGVALQRKRSFWDKVAEFVFGF
jgi:hypothetical protein